jgi:GxxExxY protein
MTELLYKQEVYAIVGAAMEVYNVLGTGFLEAVYQEALEIEMLTRGIPFQPQQELQVVYKGRPLKRTYIADMIAYDAIIVELKAIERLTSREESQLLNYLKAAKMPVGVLLNFGMAHQLDWKRMAMTKR